MLTCSSPLKRSLFWPLLIGSLLISAPPTVHAQRAPLAEPASASPAASAPERLIESGPMVGFASAREVRLWLRTTRPAEVTFTVWPKGDITRATRHVARTGGHDGRTLQHTLIGLPSGTRFQYEVSVDGVPQPRPYPLAFQTIARWHRRTPPPDLTIALGSCSYLNEYPDDSYGGEVEVFESLRAQSPDLMLWLGDNLYLHPEDWVSKEGIFRRYASTRAHAELQAFLGSVHHYAIWDDHDYGPNDGNQSYPLKGASLEAFKEFWGNPSYGLPELPGVFGQVSWSDVDIFLLDNRTYRSAASAPPSENSYLGERQVRWLLDALSASRASFKLIASGSQVISPYSRFESYAQHPGELQRLLRGIKERRVEGVIFLSGDRHHAELNVLRDDPQFYPLYDFTSSPLTSRPARSSDDELNSPRRVPGTFVKGRRNFGLIKVTGPEADRALTMETRGVDGSLLWTYTVKASSLKIPSPPQD